MTSYNELDIRLTNDVAELKTDMGYVKRNMSKLLDAVERVERTCAARGACTPPPAPPPAPPAPALSGRIWSVLAGVPGMVTAVTLALLAAMGPILDGAAKLIAVVMSYINTKP